MIIGIDIDDTITNTIESIDKIITDKGLDVTSNFDIYNEAELKEYFTVIIENIDKLFETVSIKEDAAECLKKLKEKNKIYIVTSRSNHFSSNIEKITLDYLKKHGILYDKFFFGIDDKKKVCMEENIDILLDDNIKNISSLKDTNTKGIIFSSKYNNDYEGLRVNSWKEFLDLVLKEG